MLKSFRRDGEVLRLRDVVQRTDLNKTTAFRILCTLEQEEMIDRLGNDQYRAKIKISRAQKFRIAYVSQSECDLFSRDVSEGLRCAANESGFDLIEFDNLYSPARALKNAAKMIEAKPDIAIEYQPNEQVAPVISSMFRAANIPLIAVSIPHPDSVYFGANGYSAGRLAGSFLAKWIKSNWNGETDAVLLLEATMAGAVPHSRLTGVLTAIREAAIGVADQQIKHLDGRGTFGSSLRAVQKYLQSCRSQRVVIAGANDASVIGALRAFNEAGRLSHCIAVGVGGSYEARMELRRANTPLLGSVGFFPEKYGARLIRLATELFHAKSVSGNLYAAQIDHRPNGGSILPERRAHVRVGFGASASSRTLRKPAARRCCDRASDRCLRPGCCEQQGDRREVCRYLGSLRCTIEALRPVTTMRRARSIQMESNLMHELFLPDWPGTVPRMADARDALPAAL